MMGAFLLGFHLLLQNPLVEAVHSFGHMTITLPAVTQLEENEVLYQVQKSEWQQ